MFYFIIVSLFNLITINIPYKYYLLENNADKHLLCSCLNFYTAILLMYFHAKPLSYYVESNKTYYQIISDYEMNEYYICIIMISYQIYNIIYSYICPKYYSIASILHHVSVILIAIPPLLGYGHYCISGFMFYIEFSTIFMTNKEVFYLYKKRDEYSTLYKINDICFNICFIIFRFILWSILYINIISSVYYIPVHFAIKYNVYSVLTILTFMQYYWVIKIINKLKIKYY
jgi:hypothetical protein